MRRMIHTRFVNDLDRTTCFSDFLFQQGSIFSKWHYIICIGSFYPVVAMIIILYNVTLSWNNVYNFVPTQSVVSNPDGGDDKTHFVDYLHPTTLSGSKTAERVKYNPSHQFSHLFNAYAQAYNKRNGRTGSLFIHPFKRKLIEDIEYFKNTVVYIHNNPVHHKFTEHAMDYPWSSYLSCISVKPTHLQRDTVIGWFDNQANFKAAHENPGDVIDLEKWLGL